MKVQYGLKDDIKAIQESLKQGYHWHELNRKFNKHDMVALVFLGINFFIALFVYLKFTGVI